MWQSHYSNSKRCLLSQIYWKLHLFWTPSTFPFLNPPVFQVLSLEITSSLPLFNFSIYIKDLEPRQNFLSRGDSIQLLLTHWAVTPLVSLNRSTARDQQSRRDKPLIRCQPPFPYSGWLCSCVPPHYVSAFTLCRDTFASSQVMDSCCRRFPHGSWERNYNRTAWKRFSWQNEILTHKILNCAVFMPLLQAAEGLFHFSPGFFFFFFNLCGGQLGGILRGTFAR